MVVIRNIQEFGSVCSVVKNDIPLTLGNGSKHGAKTVNVKTMRTHEKTEAN